MGVILDNEFNSFASGRDEVGLVGSGRPVECLTEVNAATADGEHGRS